MQLVVVMFLRCEHVREVSAKQNVRN